MVAIAELDRRVVWGRGSFSHPLGARSSDAAARSIARDARPVAAAPPQALAGDISPGKGSDAPVATAGGAAVQWPHTTAVGPDTIGAKTAAPLSPGRDPGGTAAGLDALGMFLSADVIVKAVMLGLAFASVMTWTIRLAKTFEFVAARLNRGQRALATALWLAEAIRPARAASSHVAQLLHAVEGEFRRSPDLRDVDGIKERITARFEQRRGRRRAVLPIN
jgi:biopolymer transport protein ExbB